MSSMQSSFNVGQQVTEYAEAWPPVPTAYRDRRESHPLMQRVVDVSGVITTLRSKGELVSIEQSFRQTI